MYELNRARLVGIGPRPARYSDVTIDLSGLGDSVPSRTALSSPPRRPAPFSLLLLENGGGKSVLLKLLFSVVLPGRRNTVGGASLDKFVLEGDTGHVVLEWLHVTTGERLVTAKVFQRRTRSSADKYPVADAWYSFRPSSTLDLATLPVVTDGRRRRLDGFKDAVEEADRGDPTTNLSWLGDEQTKWRSHLRDCGIEPDLFDIQRRMNVDEGEAAKAFKYESSKEFVDWLLGTVTDPKDASSVAETFSKWATNLADRQQMILERDFLEGVIAGLDPLAEAHAAHQTAAREAVAAVRAAERLAVALAGRLEREEARVTAMSGEHTTAVAAAATRATERDAARALANEVKLQTFRLRLAEVEERKVDVEQRLARAQLEVAGWVVMPDIEKRDQAIANSEQLAAQVAAADVDAAPALTRRDQAAANLIAKYHAEAASKDDEATGHDTEVEGGKQEAALADEDRTRATDAAATIRERQRNDLALVKAAGERVAESVNAGLVPPGTTPAQIPRQAEDAREAHGRALTFLGERQTTATEAESTRHTAERALSEAQSVERSAEATSEAASAALATVENEGRRVAELAVVREAFGPGNDTSTDATAEVARGDAADQPHDHLTVTELDEAADRLLEQLARDHSDHTDHVDELRNAQKTDARLFNALGEGGLLPPRAEVEDALEMLAVAGVAAHAGWRYLHDTVHADERTDLIAAHPALADGVVVVDGSQMDLARTTLADGQLMPAAALAVGSGAAFLGGSTTSENTADEDAQRPAVAMTFVVNPNPALYDEESAAARREELREQMIRRGTQLVEAERQLQAVTDARQDLFRWRRVSPPGQLNRLRDTAQATRQKLDEAHEDVGNAGEALRDAAAAHQDALEAVKGAASDERQAHDRASRLESLSTLVESANLAQLRLPAHEAELHKYQAVEEAALQRRRRAEQHQEAHVRLAVQARTQAERHRAACAGVPSTNGTPADVVPSESLAALKAVAEATQMTYRALEVDPDLRRQAEEAAQDVTRLRDTLAMRDAKHIAEAERLLATPAGADRASWKVGIANARITEADLDAEARELLKGAGQLENAISTASPKEHGRTEWVALTDQWRPTSPTHGEELSALAELEYGHAQTRLDEATAMVTEKDGQRRDASDTVRDVNQALIPLTTLLAAVPDGVRMEPYSGSAVRAQEASTEAVRGFRDTKERAERCRADLADAAQELTNYASQSVYEALATPTRRSILDSSHDTVAARAAEWSQAAQGRLASLTSDIENANKHRKNIVDRLSALVDQASKTLRRASKLSRLPADLAEWGGRPFLNIKFTEPEPNAISIRVGEVVDRVAAEYATRAMAGKSRNARRDGMALLLDAVHASVPKGFEVDVLKPDSVLRDERVGIEEMNDVFSGGQELTAAIVLYCTLAALAANERGQMRSKHSGVLFLDNPIGRANASYLIDLQQSVARSLGVQLIYTTGISDDRVLAAFPLWVRLRNDADLRAGLKHIQVAEIVRRQLPAPYADADLFGGDHAEDDFAAPGTVTAARVYRNSPEAPPDADDLTAVP